MSIRTRKEVLADIKKVVKRVGGKEYEAWEAYFGTDFATGNKLRKVKASKAELIEGVNEFFKHIQAHGGSMLGLLKPREAYDARDAIDTLKEAGAHISLSDVVRRWLDGQDMVTVHERPLGDAYAEYFAAIPEAQYLHRRAVNTRVRRWVTAFGATRNCTEVTSREVAEYLVQFSEPKTFNNQLGYIKAFMGWCAKSERRYIPSNPLEDMATAQLAYKEPEYMHAEDVDLMMRAIQKRHDANRLVSYAALSFFCGIRQEEIKRLAESPGDIQFDEEIIRISMPKGWTKGVIPRVVQIPPNALEWLMTYDPRKYLVKDTSRTVEILQSVAREAGVEFPKNAGRHTFITMHVAAYGDPSKTEAMVGTSSKMRTAHYQGLASRKEGERYFAIMP